MTQDKRVFAGRVACAPLRFRRTVSALGVGVGAPSLTVVCQGWGTDALVAGPSPTLRERPRRMGHPHPLC